MVYSPRSLLDPRLMARQLELCSEKLREIERLVESNLPGVRNTRRRVAALATALERSAPHGGIADLARKVAVKPRIRAAGAWDTYLWHLKAELEACANRPGDLKA
jgi:hypothetical protein